MHEKTQGTLPYHVYVYPGRLSFTDFFTHTVNYRITRFTISA